MPNSLRVLPWLALACLRAAPAPAAPPEAPGAAVGAVEANAAVGAVEATGGALNTVAPRGGLQEATGPDTAGQGLASAAPDAPLSEQLEPAWGRVRERLSETLAWLPLLAMAGVVFLGFLLLALWTGRWDPLYERLTSNVFVRSVLRQVVRAAVLLVGLLVAVEILGITTLVGAVLGTAGIAGVALGFAFKDIVENYLAGVLLSLRHPFAPNDDVSIEGQRGKVVRLTSRETILMSHDGNHIRIPNAIVFRGIMVNYSRNPRRRFEVRLTVAPDSDLRGALETGRDTLGQVKGVLENPPPSGRVVEVGDSWITLQWFGWMDQVQADFTKVRSEAIRLVLAALTDAGIEMPPPEHHVRILRGEEEEPDRAVHAAGPGPQLDVSVDPAVDEQIAEDRRASPETDLLEPEGS